MAKMAQAELALVVRLTPPRRLTDASLDAEIASLAVAEPLAAGQAKRRAELRAELRRRRMAQA